MSLVMEGVYGKQVYAKSGHPNWRKVSEKPTFKKVGKQGINQCGYYVMKYASSYDGDGFAESILTNDVCYLFEKMFHFTVIFILVGFSAHSSQMMCCFPGPGT